MQALACAALLSDPDPGDLVVVTATRTPATCCRSASRLPEPERLVLRGPDPCVTERAYDLGVATRDFSATLLASPGTAAERVWSLVRPRGAASGTDPGRVWAWGLLERVSTGLYVTSFGAPRVGAPFLRTAALLVEQGRPD